MNRPRKIYACLYVREFPAQALLRLRPDLRERPCVVMAGEPPLQQLCSLNTRARLLGMECGMTQVEVETFPACAVLNRSLAEEASTREVLLECAGTFSPRVETVLEENAFACMIDIAGTEALFGSPENLARRLLKQARPLGISARLAVSHNFHAALVMARGGPARTPVRIIASGQEAEALSSLPVGVLPLTALQAETLRLWGIHNLGMLAELPEKALIARMGQEGKHLRLLARGESPHLFQPVEPAFTLEEHMELDSPVDLLESLLFVIALLLEQLIHRSTARVLALASVTVTCRLEGGGNHGRTVRQALPNNDRQTWLKLLHLDLEAHPPLAPILALTLTAEPGVPGKTQLGLFSPQLPEPARLDVTLARIRALVGEHHVGRATLQDTHAAESFRMEPFTAPLTTSTAVLPIAPQTAPRRLRPPEATTVFLQRERPSAFFFRQVRYTVEHAYGPWRTSGGWWDQNLWSEEHWDLIARSAQDATLFCCVVHDRTQNRWQVAALYD